MERLKKSLKKLSPSAQKLNPYVTDPTSQPATSPRRVPSPAAALLFCRPASPREPRDFLAEAREAAGRHYVTGRKVAEATGSSAAGALRNKAQTCVAVGATKEPNGTGTDYDAYVREMKRRREKGWNEVTEYFTPEPKVKAEYYG